MVICPAVDALLDTLVWLDPFVLIYLMPGAVSLVRSAGPAADWLLVTCHWSRSLVAAIDKSQFSLDKY
jgi:hypothetical protein